MPEPNNQADTADTRNLNWKIITACIGICGTLVAAWILISFAYGSPKTPAEFGDMFGGVNALFSGLAFVGLIWAILLQKQELQLQREELKDTRLELAGQREQLEFQNSTFKQQAFDSVFFQMLGLHNQIIGSMEVIEHDFSAVFSGESRPDTIHSGRDCFSRFYDDLYNHLTCSEENIVDLASLRESYGAFFDPAESDLGHYFRNLYTTIKLVDQSEIQDKKKYTNIVRAQLSSYELLLLFYNCLSDNGRGKFKPLVEEYAIFKNLPDKLLINSKHKKLI